MFSVSLCIKARRTLTLEHVPFPLQDQIPPIINAPTLSTQGHIYSVWGFVRPAKGLAFGVWLFCFFLIGFLYSGLDPPKGPKDPYSDTHQNSLSSVIPIPLLLRFPNTTGCLKAKYTLFWTISLTINHSSEYILFIEFPSKVSLVVLLSWPHLSTPILYRIISDRIRSRLGMTRGFGIYPNGPPQPPIGHIFIKRCDLSMRKGAGRNSIGSRIAYGTCLALQELNPIY
jgi:hypothetical protein